MFSFVSRLFARSRTLANRPAARYVLPEVEGLEGRVLLSASRLSHKLAHLLAKHHPHHHPHHLRVLGRAGSVITPAVIVVQQPDAGVPVTPPPDAGPPTNPPPQPQPGPDATPLGDQVVKFAHDRLNQQVGAGQCADLVVAALQAVGARTTFDYGVSGPDADYVWGNLVATYRAGDAVSALAAVQPGDIVQFRDVTIVEGFGSWSYPHHTAIVETNNGDGRFTVLEQNVNNEQWVHEDALNLGGMTQGTVWIYRPVAS